MIIEYTIIKHNNCSDQHHNITILYHNLTDFMKHNYLCTGMAVALAVSVESASRHSDVTVLV